MHKEPDVDARPSAMSDYLDHRRRPLSVVRYPNNVTIGSDSVAVNEQSYSMNGSRSAQGHSQATLPYDYGQQDGYQSTPDHYTPQTHTHRRQRHLSFLGHAINPALLTPMEHPRTPPSASSHYGEQYLEIGGQFYQSMSLPISASAEQSTEDPWNGVNEYQHHDGLTFDAERTFGQPIDVPYDEQNYVGSICDDLTLNEVQQGFAPEEWQSMPVSAVLGRDSGYQAELAYVMHRMPTGQGQQTGGIAFEPASPLHLALSHSNAHSGATLSQVYGPMGTTQQLIPDIVVSTPIHPNAFSSEAQLGPATCNEHPSQTDPQLCGRAPSPPSSVMGGDALRCSHSRCTSSFTGIYRRGNLARHNRLKHRGQVVQYKCEDDDCMRVFNRQDARLKHYRKHHVYLAQNPILSRKASTSTGTGGWDYPDCSQRTDSHTSPCDSQCIGDCDTPAFSAADSSDYRASRSG